MEPKLLKLEQRLKNVFAPSGCMCGAMNWVTPVLLAWALREAGLDPAAVAARLNTDGLLLQPFVPPHPGEFAIVEGASGLWRYDGEGDPQPECLDGSILIPKLLGVAAELMA